jgi:hypothetical protein
MDLHTFGVAIAGTILLVILVALILGSAQRREMRKALGLPPHTKLGPEDKRAFLAFENTDMQLRDSFPDVSKRHRQAIARKLLRDNGLLPKGLHKRS